MPVSPLSTHGVGVSPSTAVFTVESVAGCTRTVVPVSLDGGPLGRAEHAGRHGRIEESRRVGQIALRVTAGGAPGADDVEVHTLRLVDRAGDAASQRVGVDGAVVGEHDDADESRVVAYSGGGSADREPGHAR